MVDYGYQFILKCILYDCTIGKIDSTNCEIATAIEKPKSVIQGNVTIAISQIVKTTDNDLKGPYLKRAKSLYKTKISIIFSKDLKIFITII